MGPQENRIGRLSEREESLVVCAAGAEDCAGYLVHRLLYTENRKHTT